MSRRVQNACFTAWVLLLFSLSAAAQLQYGDLKIGGSGTLTGGYNANYGDTILSNHSFVFGGAGMFDGSFYNPSFLAFNVHPYYNQSRANSSIDSIFNAGGLDANFRLFSGSHFPGSVGFSDYFNRRSTFGMANGPEWTTNGRGYGFNLAWSELLPGFPTFTAMYSVGTGAGTVLGTDQESRSHTRVLNLRSTYNVAGFRLAGGYQRGNVESRTPGGVVGASEFDSSGKNDNLNFQFTHKFPFNGSFYGNLSQMHFENFFAGESQGKTRIDMFDSGLVLVPTVKASISVNASYADNLYAAVNQAIAGTGIAPATSLGHASSSYSISASGSYAILNGLYAAASVTHEGQKYFGREHAATFFTGTLYGNYRKPLFGVLNWSISVIDNATQEGNTNVGVNTMVSASRRISRWEVGGDLAYQQNVETLLVGYTVSSLHWGAHTTRRSNHWNWNVGAGGSKSVLTAHSEDGNHSENVFSSIYYRGYTANVTFSRASGTSVLTSNGLQSVAIAPVVLPTQYLILYDAKSYGISGSASPTRALGFFLSYSSATSMASSTALTSNNATSVLDVHGRYQARRLSFNFGFERFSQSVSAGGALPEHVNSYYVGVSRWFGFF